MLRPEEPQAASSTFGSSHVISLAVSAAIRPYSVAVLAAICQSPSSSLPRHRSRTLWVGVGRGRGACRRASCRPDSCSTRQPAGAVRAAGAEVDREHRLDPGRAAPGDELVGAEGVGLGREPGEVEAPGPRLERADAVLPVVAGDEVAAGIAHHRGAELAHQRQHVLAEALRVGGRVAGLEDAAVDAAAEVLDEGAEQAAVGRADRDLPVEPDPGGAHGPAAAATGR